MMFYIHKAICISAQQTFKSTIPEKLADAVDNKMMVIEPVYEGVNPSVLRRFGKTARIAIGAAMPMVQEGKTDGIIIGTANGGMEESIRFLKQIISYNEDMLAPGAFVQSTANATAAQMGMITKNNGYNITHVHRAHAFENAALDAAMLLAENENASYIIGGVDEIGTYQYNIEVGVGWYKKEKIAAAQLYESNTKGTIAGEGAAMFLVNKKSEGAMAKLQALQALHSTDARYVKDELRTFLEKNAPDGIDLLITGENGDNRYSDIFDSITSVFDERVTIARFKHISGEYPTASAFALWLAATMNEVTPSLIKRKGTDKPIANILVYNFYQGAQHSFMLVAK